MVKVIIAFCWHQKFVPRGFSALAPGAIYMYKIIKNAYKIRFQRSFWNLQHMGKGKRPFCCHQNFVPNELSAHAQGYIHMVKHEKNVYKIRLQSNFFLNLQRMGKMIRAFCWHQKFVPKGLSALAPGLYTYIKSLKMCIKSYFFF